MSAKAVVRALAALAVLVFLWGAFTLFRGSVSDRPAGLQLPKLTAADVDRIEVATATDTLRFARTAAGWSVNGFAADGAQLNQVFDALRDSAATSELVARSPGSHSRLGVDSSGRHVVFAKGTQVLLDLVIGASGRTFQTAYVRPAGSDDVFLWRGGLPGLLGKDLDGWRDRRIAAVAADSIGTVRVQRTSRWTTLGRSDDGWTVGGAPADTAVVGRLLRALANVTAMSFASPAQADSLDFGRPDRALTVLGRGGDTLLALVFDSTSAGYWGRRAAGGEPFRLDFWRMDELTPADSLLRARAR